MAVESLKTLRRRLRAVKNTGKITRAMEMVAAAKLRRAQATLMAARPYGAKLQELLAGLAATTPELQHHPLFERREGNRKVLVIFTGDRGLSGAFNANIIKRAEDLLRSEPQTDWQLVCIGRKGRDYFARRRWPILESAPGPSGAGDLAEVRRVADRLRELFLSRQADQVILLYSAFISTIVYRPTRVQYLPLSAEALGFKPEADGRAESQVDYIFDPSGPEVFGALLPRFLGSMIYIILAEVATSENSARMIAMNNATKNCTEMADSLTLRLNKARQNAITKELLEIVGGAEALKAG